MAQTKIDISRQVDFSRQSCVMAFKSSTQTVGTGTDTKITFDTEDIDTLSEFTSSTFTAKTAGIYLVSAQIRSNNLPDNVRFRVSIYLNAAIYAIGENGITNSGSSGYGSAGVCCLVILAVGNTLDVYGYHDKGTDGGIFGGSTRSTFISIVKVA